MSYLKDREIWLSNVPTGNPPAGYFWKFIQNGKVVVRDSSGNNQIMVATSGSQAITGSLTVTEGITGTVSSASYVEYSNVANKPALVSGSSQITYSGLTGIPSGIVSGSAQITSFGIFATTGSNGFNGSQSITGSLTVTGQVVAQTLNVQQVTSSVVFSSGSNVFGNSLSNTQQFTGSVGVTGSLSVNGASSFSSNVTATGNLNLQGAVTRNINFYDSSNTNINAQIQYDQISSTSGQLFFGTNNAGTFATRLTISNTGAATFSNNVGINGVSPTYPLYVRTGTNQRARFVDNGGLFQFGVLNDAEGAYSDMSLGNSAIMIKSSGNVGIGTTSPDVTGFGWRTLTIRGGTSSGEAGVLELQSPSTTGAANLGIIAFLDGSTRGGQIYVQRDSSTTTSNMLFATNGGSGIVERMRITSAGVVRIGDDSNPYLEIANGGSTDVLSGIRWMVGGSRVNYGGVEMAAPSADNGYMIFKTRNSGTTAERMRITSGGNTVLGGNAGSGWSTASGRTTLEIYGSIYPSALHNSTSVGNSLSYNTYWDGTNWRFVQSSTSVIYIQDSEGHKFLHNSAGSAGASFTPTERMRITSGGNVGIGITGPSEKLEVNGSLRLSDGNADGPQLKLASSGYSDWNIDNFSGNLRAYYGSTEYLRVTSNGALAIGTTDVPTLSTPNGGQLIVMPNAVIVSGIIALGSPYTQNIQIDIVYNNWGGNNVIGLVDMIITLREFANIAGTAFGKVFAVNGGSGATFTSFNTTDVTTSQCSVTAVSGGNYTLRITIDPSNVTDRGSFYLTIPNAGGTGSSINSIVISYV